MRSLKDVNRGGRAAALALLGAIIGALAFLVVAWPQTRRQVQCEELAERVAYPIERLTRRVKETPEEFARDLERAAGDAREAILAGSSKFLRLDITDRQLRRKPDVLVERFRGLAAMAVAVDGSPDSRERFDDERGRLVQAVRGTARVCAR